MLDFAALLAQPNVKALLRVIREGESSQDDDVAYRMRYGGAGNAPAFFGDYSQHPRIFEVTPTGERSSAAGAYQFTATTWDWIAGKYGLGPGFDPLTQDCAAVALVNESGGLEPILDGRLEEAVTACARHWASLPGSPLEDGGSKMLWDRVRRVYDRYGGTALVSAPIEDRGRPAQPADVERITEQEKPMAAPLLMMLPAIMQAITQAIPALSTLFGKDGEKVGAKVGAATAVIDIVTRAVGGVNAQDAVEKITTNPAQAEAARVAVLSDPGISMMLQEVGGGIAAAHARAIDPAQPPLHKNPAFWMSLMLLPMAYYVVVAVIGLPWGGKFLAADVSQEVRSMVIGGIMGTVIGGIVAFWLGTSYGSARKTDIISSQQTK